MTIIEFFDKTHIENIVSTLLLKPKKVIFVGNNRKMMERCTENYSEVVKRHGIETEFVFCTVNQNDLLKIVQELSQIVEREEECVFDLSGGEDLYLVAVGILFERYGEKIQMHRYNISNGRLTDCDSQGDVQFYNNLSVSVEDNVRIYGGKIIRDSFSENFDNATVFDDDFRKDIDSMWNISSQNSRLWNSSVNVIQFFYSAYGKKDCLTLEIEKTILASRFNSDKLELLHSLFRQLSRAGLLTEYINDEESISVTFKNEKIRDVLTTSGQILEYKITSVAQNICESDGTPVYSDVRTGVFIDWDGVISDGYDVINEIDVMMTKNLIPVFVSCKNGQLGIDELYKLSLVAERFGGKYAKKVLITSDITRLGRSSEYIRERAKEMKIKLIENVDLLSEEELRKTVRNLYKS